MKKRLLILLFSLAVFGCSSLELEAVSTSTEETQRILSMGLSHEENLKEANKLPSKHMISVVTLQLTNARDEKIQEQVDIVQLLSMGDIAHGEKVFKKCSACHMVVSDGKNMIGPNLWNVIGRKAGSISDYNYSKAMVAYGKEWTFEEMNAYLIKPQAYVKGTKMAFAGLRKEKDRASVILFMNSKSNNPKPIP